MRGDWQPASSQPTTATSTNVPRHLSRVDEISKSPVAGFLHGDTEHKEQQRLFASGNLSLSLL